MTSDTTGAIETYVVDGDGVAVDLIVWRRYRRRTPGLVEQVYGLNQGLAALGPLLPRGTIVRIPLDQSPPVARVPVVRLF